ncbi:hypothetical protein [Tychonema sp. BBK16]
MAQVCEYLQHRPIALFDSEYGCAPLVKATAAIGTSTKLVNRIEN